MSILRNLLGQFMPHPESRRSSGTLAALNAEVIHDLNGDESVTFYLVGTVNLTYNIQGSVDGVNYFDLICFPYGPASFAGGLPHPAQPMVSEFVNISSAQRLLCAATGGLQRVRIRATAYTSGSFATTIISDTCASVHPYVRDQRACTLTATVTAAIGVGATLTLPAVASLRHYIDRVQIIKFNGAALTAAATPVLVTTTNISGNPVMSFTADAAAQGTKEEQFIDVGGAGLAATASNTTTTIVCPATTGVIWRVNAIYRLGI